MLKVSYKKMVQMQVKAPNTPSKFQQSYKDLKQKEHLYAGIEPICIHNILEYIQQFHSHTLNIQNLTNLHKYADKNYLEFNHQSQFGVLVRCRHTLSSSPRSISSNPAFPLDQLYAGLPAQSVYQKLVGIPTFSKILYF